MCLGGGYGVDAPPTDCDAQPGGANAAAEVGDVAERYESEFHGCAVFCCFGFKVTVYFWILQALLG